MKVEVNKDIKVLKNSDSTGYKEVPEKSEIKNLFERAKLASTIKTIKPVLKESEISPPSIILGSNFK